MADIELRHIDETYIRIDCERPYLTELKEHFSFLVPNHRFHPKVRAGIWDGRISLINLKERTIYKGLLPDLIDFCDQAEYSYVIDDKILEKISPYEIDADKVTEFYDKIGGPYILHDSQMDAVIHTINNGRSIILAPTANGKSYIIHGLTMFHALQKRKVLIIVDRSQLVEQLRSDIRDEYHGGKLARVHTIYDQVDPSKADIFLTTWQSVYENPAKWFKQFDVLIGDEVHKFKADSLKTILSHCGHISIRHGFTATLDNDSKTDRLTLIGMFGTPHRVATTKELIEAGIVAKPTVYAILFKYSNQAKREIYKTHGTKRDKGGYYLEFNDEVDFLENLELRNKFIADLDSKVSGNTLIAFKREVHGKNILEQIKLQWQKLGKSMENKLFFINHKVDKNKRIAYSKLIDSMEDATGVVSIGTFGTGINIKNINNILVACQVKSKINVPQLIGRGLRLSDKKSTVSIIDLGDDLSVSGKDNATLTHFKERLQMYADEGFEIKFKQIEIM